MSDYSTAASFPPVWAKPVFQPSNFDVDLTGMRVHELALARWCNYRFLTREGYPIPVLFSAPESAFSDFQKVWSESDSPFSYLKQAVDANGALLYRPDPLPVFFPLLTIKRTTFRYSPRRSFSPFWNRQVGWPTVSADVKKADLGNVYQSSMPAAWDYGYQLDFYSMRPDTLAFFIRSTMQAFGRSRAQAQMWIQAIYPGLRGSALVRVVLDNDSMSDITEEEVAEDKLRIYRLTMTLTLEGWEYDTALLMIPSFWKTVSSVKAIDPNTLASQFNPAATETTDLRPIEGNLVFNSTSGLPTE